MSPLKAINVFLLQWLFMRLTRHQEKRIENYTPTSYDLMPDGNISSRGKGDVNTYQWYSLQMWILPCTGWWNNFIYLNKKPYFFVLTKPKLKLL